MEKWHYVENKKSVVIVDDQGSIVARVAGSLGSHAEDMRHAQLIVTLHNESAGMANDLTRLREVEKRAIELEQALQDAQVTPVDLGLMRAQIERMTELLVDLASQCCGQPDGQLASLGISTYASLLETLAGMGRVRIVEQRGRLVHAEWIPE